MTDRAWRLRIPADAELADVIRVLNALNLRVMDLAGEGEAALFRRFGPEAVWFEPVPPTPGGGTPP